MQNGKHDNVLINENSDNYVYRHKSSPEGIYVRDNNSNTTRFGLDRGEIMNGGQRTAIGITVRYLVRV